MQDFLEILIVFIKISIIIGVSVSFIIGIPVILLKIII